MTSSDAMRTGRSCGSRSSPSSRSSKSRRSSRCASAAPREMMAHMSLAVLAVALAMSVLQIRLDPEPGISESLARERHAAISDLRYDLAFTIPAARTEPVRGRALIRFSLASVVGPLVLDYEPDRAGILREVEANGVATRVR